MVDLIALDEKLMKEVQEEIENYQRGTGDEMTMKELIEILLKQWLQSCRKVCD
jgi:hypothetical protein